MSDLIDRKTVFDVIDKCILEKLEGDTVEIKEPLKLITKIYRIPSAQPQRKIGRWIEKDNSPFYCSVCGTYQYSASWEIKNKEYNFCPNCGADMRGESE